MPTDDERREVARRLRETGDELESAALLWYHIAKALGVRTATDGKTACGMLADLIEPTTGDYDEGYRAGLQKARDMCDRDALLELADEMEQIADGNRLTGMMSIGRARSWADSIREALGVER